MTKLQSISGLAFATLALAGCKAKDDSADDGPADAGGLTATGGGDDGGSSGESGATTGAVEEGPGDMGGGDTAGLDDEGEVPDPPVVFDVGAIPDAGENNVCGAPAPVTCDDTDDDPMHALGLNCPGGPQVDEGAVNAGAESWMVYEGNLGSSAPPEYPPREGSKFLILSTGGVMNLFNVNHPDSGEGSTSPDPGFALPAPLVMSAVDPLPGGDTCADDPTLIGTGECSNTLNTQWSQGSGANDYAEVRITTEVPAGTFGFSYDFAFFSQEYPQWFGTEYNDMYVAWLESEVWTGNISFDEMGNPISLNAGFLDNLPGSPALAGTAMANNAGTKWLVTTAGVNPGETIEVVFAVWDLSDDIWNTVVIIDNWLWDCEGGPPVTIPG